MLISLCAARCSSLKHFVAGLVIGVFAFIGPFIVATPTTFIQEVFLAQKVAFEATEWDRSRKQSRHVGLRVGSHGRIP